MSDRTSRTVRAESHTRKSPKVLKNHLQLPPLLFDPHRQLFAESGLDQWRTGQRLIVVPTRPTAPMQLRSAGLQFVGENARKLSVLHGVAARLHIRRSLVHTVDLFRRHVWAHEVAQRSALTLVLDQVRKPNGGPDGVVEGGGDLVVDTMFLYDSVIDCSTEKIEEKTLYFSSERRIQHRRTDTE